MYVVYQSVNCTEQFGCIRTYVGGESDAVTVPYWWPEWSTQHIDNEGSALMKDNGHSTCHHAHTADNMAMVEAIVTGA